MKKAIIILIVLIYTIILFVSKADNVSKKEALGITENTLSSILATEYIELLERLTTLLPNQSVLFSNEEQYFKTISSMARACMKLDKNGFSFKDCAEPLLQQMIEEGILEEKEKIILKYDYYKTLSNVTVQYKKISDYETQILIKWNQNINEPYFENFKKIVIHKINLRGEDRITAIESK
ncbi:hypothetical protein [Sulfurospirillum cavolei]|uniref:hypothetical protein n=1 Tax=Sulfurospirillum cavolei TaxID=366522 RepID=UPI003FA2AF9C